MLKSRRLVGLLFWGSLLSFAGASDFDLPDEPFDIRAGRMEYVDGTLVASGGVTGRFENVMIRADRIRGNPETGDLHAEGDILFERGNMLWQGSELDYNFIKQDGLFGPSSLYFEPAFMSVDHVERVSTNEYLLRGATFTTCPKDHPHISAHAKEARLIGEKYIQAKGVTFYVGKVPVMYVPFWRHTLSENMFTFNFGIGSEWGTYLQTKTTVPITENVNSITDVNLYSHRGVGLGQGFAWEYPKAVGAFAAFYLKDEDPHSRYDLLDPIGQQIGDDRYRFKLEHIQNFTDTHYLNTKWNYLSDPAILEEFFKSEYRNNAQPENYASWVYGNSYVGSEVFVNKRLNDFYENTDRVEYSADLYRTRLGNSPFFLQSENAIAHLERVHSSTNTLAGNAYDSVRIDSANALYLPQRYGFLNLVPRATYRATYYSKTGGGSEEFRQIPGAGMEVSFQATKILSEQEHWYGKGLRHKIEPYADYIYENTSISANRLFPVDGFDDVDTLKDENKVQIGLRNVLQTQRDGRLARFIDLDLYTYYLVEKNGASNDLDLLYIDARMPLTKRTMVDLEGKYDWYAGKISYFNTRISYDHDDLIFSLEHLYEESARSLWTPRIDLFPTGNTSVEVYGRYDDNDNDLQEVALVGYKNFCCMRYGLGYHYYDDGEQRIMFSIGLSAFPEARISSGF